MNQVISELEQNNSEFYYLNINRDHQPILRNRFGISLSQKTALVLFEITKKSFKWSKSSNQANLVDFTNSLLSILEWKEERVFLNKSILSGKEIEIDYQTALELTDKDFQNIYNPSLEYRYADNNEISRELKENVGIFRRFWERVPQYLAIRNIEKGVMERLEKVTGELGTLTDNIGKLKQEINALKLNFNELSLSLTDKPI